MITKLKARFARLPKPVRFLLKAVGSAVAIVVIVPLLPVLGALWAVTTVLAEIIDAYERS